MYDMSCMHMLNFFEFIKTFRQSLLKENNWFLHTCVLKKKLYKQCKIFRKYKFQVKIYVKLFYINLVVYMCGKLLSTY